MSGCINGTCGGGQLIDPSQTSQQSSNAGSAQIAELAGGDRGAPGTAQSTGCANGSCGGGAKGGGAMAHTSPGCPGGTCGGSKASSSGGCSDGSCGGGAQKAQQSDCSNGQCGGKKGLFKATMMTVASAELAQLTLDYSQYLS